MRRSGRWEHWLWEWERVTDTGVAHINDKNFPKSSMTAEWNRKRFQEQVFGPERG